MQLMARCQRLAFGSISAGAQPQQFSFWDSPHGTVECHEARERCPGLLLSHPCPVAEGWRLHSQRAASVCVAYRKLGSKYLSARKSLSERQPEGFGCGGVCVICLVLSV